MLQWAALALVFVFLWGPAVSLADDIQRADRLLYREALYHIHNNDYFRALTLLENSHTGANHVENPFHNRNHLLAVQSALHLDMHSQARSILEHLQFTSRDETIRDLARVHWGKLHYQEGHWQQAIEELRQTSSRINQEQRNEAGYYLAMSYLHLGQAEQAATVLGKMSGESLWTAYGYYNLGMHYAQSDGNPARALIALRVAGTMVNQSPEGLAISDRIHLGGGYLALRGGEYDKAINFLRKVRMKGESAPAALFYYGQAYAGMGQYRAAVQIWHRARKYALVLPGVAESFQAIGFGFEQEQLRTSAMEAYLDAVRVYEKELVQLDELSKEVSRHGVRKILLEGQVNQDLEWFLLTDVVTNTPKVGFIGYLMSDGDFYARAKTLLELRELQTNNTQAMARLKLFDDMLAQHQRGVARRIGNAGVRSKAAALNRLIEQRNALVRELESTRQDQADLQYEEDRRRAIQALAELDEQLRLYRDNLAGFKQRIESGPGQYQAYRKRIADLRTKSARLDKELQAFIQQEDRVLTEQAQQMLEQHRNNMIRYRLESQMALVNLFDAQAVAQHQSSRSRVSGSGGGQ